MSKCYMRFEYKIDPTLDFLFMPEDPTFHAIEDIKAFLFKNFNYWYKEGAFNFVTTDETNEQYRYVTVIKVDDKIINRGMPFDVMSFFIYEVCTKFRQRHWLTYMIDFKIVEHYVKF